MKCTGCRCYHCINTCVCSVCRTNRDDAALQESLDMQTDSCMDFVHPPVLNAGPCMGNAQNAQQRPGNMTERNRAYLFVKSLFHADKTAAPVIPHCGRNTTVR